MLISILMATYNGSEDTDRSELYRLFAGLFAREPDDDMLLRMTEMFQLDFEELPHEIKADFSLLFSGAGSRLMPYESMHRYPLGDSPKLMGRAAEDVLKFYNSAGLTIDEQTNLLPDHISAELLFMAYLVEHGLAEKQRSFMEEHLQAWIPEFCDKVMEIAGTTFYREAAGLLKEFMASEYGLLSNDYGLS